MRNALLLLVLAACGASRPAAETVPSFDDQDRVLGDADRCPDAPEDEDGFEDEDGCPDSDDDGDGRLDGDDLCPREPEDLDAFEDEDGCPDPDNDQDRVLDASDACPEEPELYNGTVDEDGCPDRGACLTYGASVELPPVVFERGTTEAAGLRGLGEVAEALRTGEVRRLAISAYAHLRVRREQELAQQRVERVRDGLVAAGFAGERLVLQVLDVAESDQADRLTRVDLTVLCDAREEYERRPDGHAERVCPTGRCDDTP